MTHELLLILPIALGILTAALLLRRSALRQMQRAVQERDRALQAGATARLQHPVVDLSRCLGCGTCVRACPEEGVLELVHGQAMVVAGARCVGHGVCESSCPVDAITVTLGDTSERDDIPALDESLQAIGQDGVYLAGEVTAKALIQSAVEQGLAVADAVRRRRDAGHPAPDGAFDLAIVGAGPAGLACALAAKAHGLSFVLLEQEHEIGGTVAKYPRQKLVLTHPVDLPLHGRLDRTTFTKEELIALWQQIVAEHELPVRTGEQLLALQRGADRALELTTPNGVIAAANVCLAIGRRGTPQKLGVPGEDLPKVAYGLLDAASFQGRSVLVVGGGDSALETALALAEQDGNQVTLSYRGEAFVRARTRNVERLEAAESEGRITVATNSRVLAIAADHVELEVDTDRGARRGRIPNDHVFVQIGGTPPFDMLRQAGVSFDPALRPQQDPVEEQGTGALPALVLALVPTLLAAAFVLWHADYYGLLPIERPTHPKHALLRPGMGLGLGLGIAATALIGANLAYLLRRARLPLFRWGTLKGWMTAHVATGILALVTALLHAAMAPRNTVGGTSFWALCVLTVTGAIGRYFYAALPRAANGRELELAELKAELARSDSAFAPSERDFGRHARRVLQERIEAQQWRSSFVGRVIGLLLFRRRLRALHAELEAEGRERGLPPEQIAPVLALAERLSRASMMVAHFEDLRAVLATWRWLHRWIALLMVALMVLHIVHALSFATIGFGGGAR
ncbi:MAG: NAD(P)-binding domain-containing protein [Planctomycetota bacterium]